MINRQRRPFARRGAAQQLQRASPPCRPPAPVSDGVAVDLSGNQLINSPEPTVSLAGRVRVQADGRLHSSRRLTTTGRRMYGRIFNRDPIDAIRPGRLERAGRLLLAPDDLGSCAFARNTWKMKRGLHFRHRLSSGVFTNVPMIEPRNYGLAVGQSFSFARGSGFGRIMSGPTVRRKNLRPGLWTRPRRRGADPAQQRDHVERLTGAELYAAIFGDGGTVRPGAAAGPHRAAPYAPQET
ncbi:MAG: hypothetical protein IPO20_22945 [Gammaproteobacteria bacterium]|nr:hypothetical protein [Gammaproteobacteria bacterium]